MSISKDALEALKTLGLTDYEVAAYVTLITYGEMNASQISSKSGIPYSRIYDVLGRLENKGWIQINRGRPTGYLAKSPIEVVKIVKYNWEETLNRCSKIIIDELQPLYENSGEAITRNVWILHGKAAIAVKLFEMLSEAEESIKFSIPNIDIYEELIYEVISKLSGKKDLKIQILTTSLSEDIRKILSHRAEVRIWGKIFGGGLVIDNKYTMIILSESADKYIAIYSDHILFAAIASNYFDSLWNVSTTI